MIVQCRGLTTKQAPPLSVLQIFRSVVDDPVGLDCAPAASRRHHRSPELHRRPESANNNSAKQKWRRQPAAAAPPRRLEPGSARRSRGRCVAARFDRSVPRRRTRARVPTCCRFSDLLSMTPYLAALTRRRRHHRSPELHRRPESANNNSAKQKWRRQPAAAAPPRRLEPVALLGAAWGAAARPTRLLA